MLIDFFSTIPPLFQQVVVLRKRKVVQGLYRILDRISLVTVRVNEVFCSLVLYIMTFVVLHQTIMRYVFNTGYGWSEEVAKLLMVWIGMLGASILVFEESHIAVLFLLERFSLRIQLYIKIVFLFLIAFFSGILVYAGIIYTMTRGGQVLPGSGLKFFWLYVPIPIGGAFMTLYAITLFLKTIEQIKGNIEAVGAKTVDLEKMKEEIELLQGEKRER